MRYFALLMVIFCSIQQAAAVPFAQCEICIVDDKQVELALSYLSPQQKQQLIDAILHDDLVRGMLPQAPQPKLRVKRIIISLVLMLFAGGICYGCYRWYRQGVTGADAAVIEAITVPEAVLAEEIPEALRGVDIPAAVYSGVPNPHSDPETSEVVRDNLRFRPSLWCAAGELASIPQQSTLLPVVLESSKLAENTAIGAGRIFMGLIPGLGSPQYAVANPYPYPSDMRAYDPLSSLPAPPQGFNRRTDPVVSAHHPAFTALEQQRAKIAVRQ